MTKLKLIAMTLVAASCALAQVQAKKSAPDFGKAPASESSKMRANAAVRPNAVTSTTLRETLISNEVTIAAGDIQFFEALSEFTGAEKVAVAIVTMDDKNKLSSLDFGVAWAAPGEWYTMTDFALGSDFASDSHGGFTTSVYGPYLKVGIINTGTTPIKIKQMTVYAVAR